MNTTVKTYKTRRNAEKAAAKSNMQVLELADGQFTLVDRSVSVVKSDTRVDTRDTDLQGTQQERGDEQVRQCAKELAQHALLAVSAYRFQSDNPTGQIIAKATRHSLFDDFPVSAIQAIAVSTKTLLGGGAFGEDVDVAAFDSYHIISAIELVFAATVREVIKAERRFEAKKMAESRQLAQAKDVGTDQSPYAGFTDTDQLQHQQAGDYINALDMLYIALGQLWDDFASPKDRQEKKSLPWASENTDGFLQTRVYVHDYHTAKQQFIAYAEKQKQEQAAIARAKAQARSLNL